MQTLITPSQLRSFASSSRSSAATKTPMPPVTGSASHFSTSPTATTKRPSRHSHRPRTTRSSRTVRSRSTMPACRGGGWARRNSRKESRSRTRCRSDRKPPTATSPRPEVLRRGSRGVREEESARRASGPLAARCDTAEMELRLGTSEGGRATAEPFVKDAELAKSKFRPLGLYYHGFACFLLNDIPAAAQVAQPTRAVRSAVRPARPIPDGPRSMPHRTRRPRPPPRSPRSSTELRRAEEGRGRGARSSPTSSRTTRGRSRGSKRCEGPAAGLRRGRGVLRRVPELRGRQVRRGAAEVPGVRQGVRRLAAEGRRCAARRLLPRADEEVRRGREDAPAARWPSRSSRDQAMYWLGKAQLGQALAADPNNADRPATRRSRPRSTRSRTRRSSPDRLAAQGDADAKARRPEMLLELADTHLHREASRSRRRRSTTRS